MANTLNSFRGGAVGFIDWLGPPCSLSTGAKTILTVFHLGLVLIATHFLRTVVGMIISFHVPGLKTHRLNALVLTVSSFADPVDFSIMTWLTRPVFRSTSSRYSPSLECRASKQPDRAPVEPRKGIAGEGQTLRPASTTRSDDEPP